MANLENNNDKENKSVKDKIESTVEKSLHDMQETVKHAEKLASDFVHHPKETVEAYAEQTKKDVSSVKWWARLLQILFWTLLILFSTVFVVINLPVTKNWAAKKVINSLNDDLKSKFSFESVDLNFFGNVTINNLVVRDYKNYPFITAKEVYADSDWFSIISNSRNLQFQSLSLDKMDMKVITYKGDSIANFIRFVELFDNGKPRDPKKPPFQLKTRIYITNSKVSIVNQNHDGDLGKWLQAENLSLAVPELKVVGPDVDAKIDNLRFTTERWGKKHYMETFSTEFSFTKQFLHLKNLTINTDHSLLQGNIKFNIHNGSWADFEKKVKLEADFKPGSQLSGYDLSYFVTDWDNYKPVNISGNLTGPLDDFTLNHFVIANPKVSINTDKLIVRHFLKANFSVITDKLSTDFTYVDLKGMLPSFIAKNLKNIADDFGRMKFSGALNATQPQIYIPNASLITGIGQAKISQFYLNDYLTSLPKYRGFAELKDFNTSVVSKNKSVGLITGKFNFEGQTFDVNTMKLKTKSQIASIEINNKIINNLYLEGTLDHKKYNGIINVNDEQAKANIKGLIDFSTPKLFADVEADIPYLNINYFSGAKGSQVMSGQINGKVSMTNINDLTTDVDFKNLKFNNGTQKIELPDSKLKSYLENGGRVIDVDSPGAVKGNISGKYNLGDLSDMLQNGIGRVFVGSVPRKLYKGQNFNFNFDIQQGLVSYFVPNLKIPDGAKVEGSYDGDSNNLIMNADAVSMKYIMEKTEDITEADKALAATNPNYKISEPKVTKDSAMLNNVLVRINTTNPDEHIFTKIQRAEYNKNVFEDISLKGRNEDNKVLHLAASFKTGTTDDEINGKLNDYAINFNQSTDASGNYVFRFEPTEIKFNNVAWKFDTSQELNHSITYRKETADFLIQNLKIFSDDSEAFIKNATFKSSKEFDIDAEVKNLDIAKLLVMQTGGNSMDIKGIANGNLKVKMNQNNLEPIINLNVDKIMMNGKSMGNLIMDVKNSSEPNIFDVKAKIKDAGIFGKNSLDVTGTINNGTSKPVLDLSANLQDFDLAFSNEFVKTVFSNMRGKANGILKISGPLDDVDYSGDIALHGFGLKLNFTGVDYSTDDTVINLSKGRAILNNIGIKDGRGNSAGSISGGIYFDTLSSMAVELVLSAQNLLVLNTTQKDFDLFWGTVYGKGDLYISGPVSGLSIKTSPLEPFKALNNSTFTFNSGSTSGVDEFKMLRFLKEDKQGGISLEEKKQTGTNMDIDFTVAVDKGTKVGVIIGDDIGNISVHGISDHLNFKMTRQGNISMNGTYTVDDGIYVSKAILEKTFQIERGSSIRWDSDAMKPALNITASKVQIVTNAGEFLTPGSSLPPLKVDLQVKLSGTLDKPIPDLDVVAPDISSQLKETLATKMSNQDDKVRQFSSILLLGNFSVIDGEVLNFNSSAVQGVGANVLFKQLTSAINTISKTFNIDFNYLPADQSSNTGDYANTNLNINLSPRVTLKTGLGIPLAKSQSVTNNYLSGEGTIEYDFSKNNDGSKILRIYSKPSNLGLLPSSTGSANANQTYGGGVVWSKSFNTFFKKDKKTKEVKPVKVSIKKDSAKKDSIK